MIEALGSIDAAHMVDDDRHRRALERRRELSDMRSGHVNLQVPADRREPRRHGERVLYAIALAEMVHVVKAHAAKAALIELLQFFGRRRGRRQRYAAVVLIGGEQIGGSGIVEAMRCGLHHDAALDAEMLMQREE